MIETETRAPAEKPQKTPSARPTVKDKKTRERAEGIGGLFQLAAFGLLVSGQRADAIAVASHGPNIATETAKIADTNEQFARVADQLADMGPYGALITAVTPMIVQILVNHGRLKAEQLRMDGVYSRERLLELADEEQNSDD